MPEFVAIDKCSSETGQCEKGTFRLSTYGTLLRLHVQIRGYARIYAHVSRVVIPTTPVNEDTVCSGIYVAHMTVQRTLQGLSVRSIELVHRKKYLLYRVRYASLEFESDDVNIGNDSPLLDFRDDWISNSDVVFK